MKKNYKIILIVVALIIVLAFFYFSSGYFENYDNSNYKFITKGTCASHNLQDLTNNDYLYFGGQFHKDIKLVHFTNAINKPHEWIDYKYFND